MNEEVLDAIKAHAAQSYPKECCGLVIVYRGKLKYVPCRNMSEANDMFVINHEDYAAAEDAGEILEIVHSHCNIGPQPSQADLVGCEKTNKPWIIVSWPTGQIQRIEPSGYKAPLLGRQFFHGVLDCYSLCRDYYREVLSIDIPDFHRDFEWWLKNQNLYMDNFKLAGFVQVPTEELREHDGIIMQVCSPVPNHAAIYIGDNKIIQHVMNRISSRDVYGGWYRKCTVAVVRHRSLM